MWATAMKLEIRTIVSAPFEENSYVVWRPHSAEAVVFDPGLEPAAIFQVLEEEHLHLVAILNTHGHADHIAGNAALKTAFPTARLYIGRGDAFMLTDAGANLSSGFGFAVVSPEADELLQDGDTVQAAGIVWDVLELPGHTPGHLVYLCRQTSPWTLWAGDVLFRGSIGRFDFPGGDGRRLIHGIRTRLFCLPEDTVVYPGHGPVTTIGHEKRTNPFVGDSAEW
ncbi:Hydroxyacylglutathione hydrolase GloC [bacterium HR36]|nr:Hydroxyacylglutathione hydrolase GloC [bacterium HR36]